MKYRKLLHVKHPVTIGEFIKLQVREDFNVSIFDIDNNKIIQRWSGKANEIPKEYIDIYTWSIYKCTIRPDALNILIDVNETWL